AKARVAEQLVHAERIAALRQPNTLRAFAEMPGELASADLNLGPDGIAVDRLERQEAVRGGTGNDLQLARLKEAAKTVQQVVPVLVDEHLAGAQKPVMVPVREMIELRLPARPLNFFSGERAHVVQVAHMARSW